MKFFFEKIRKELVAGQEQYKKKYFFIGVVSALGWPALLVFLGFEFSIVGSYLDAGRELTILLFLAPIFFYVAGRERLYSKADDDILQKITLDNGGVYKKTLDLEGEKSAMLNQSPRYRATRAISFIGDSGERIRFFQYSFQPAGSKIGGKSPSYRVFSIAGLGVFPHMYLNYRKDLYSMSLGQKLSLPSDFEKEFELSIPPSYHLEALQIFTPDIIHEILELPLRCDIEFVNGEILFFLEGSGSLAKGLEGFEKKIESAKKMVSLLKPKLENLRWAPVGDKAYYM